MMECRAKSAIVMPMFGVILAITLNFMSTSLGGEVMPRYPIDVTISVDIKEDNKVLVRTVFTNNGDRTVFVKEGEFGFGYGDPDRSCKNPGTPGNPEFFITSGEQIIHYKGTRSFRAPPMRTAFKPISPGQIVDVRCTRIDGSYAFLSGTHRYKIYHSHYEYDEHTGEHIAHQAGAAEFTFTRK